LCAEQKTSLALSEVYLYDWPYFERLLGEIVGFARTAQISTGARIGQALDKRWARTRHREERT
jgi:hypothetical protein